ncbi:hypothetical protein HPB48_007030 [Haemaphysalis longicornis]|uniref:Egal-1 winged helix domain-containing protein n=1 Tax=Haemaphysalis longicornis TaxID=44386 RepID=A0A9J6FDH7_HAELO|nr:hypothetical protein HPB48_007030 [Haemaphysalis longicornis]
MSERSSRSSEAVVKLLKGRVESHPGISLQQLAGHLSQLPPELRTRYGSSGKSLMALLQKFPGVFVIHNNNVHLVTENHQGTSSVNSSADTFIASASYRGTNEKDMTCLTNITGTVYRLFRLYGFISIESPLRASVYFDAKSFENAQHTSLPSSGLQVEDRVIFDAKVGPKGCKARFRASCVTRATMTGLSSSPGLSPQSVNGAGRGGCDTTPHLINQHGVVEFVKSDYGFIKFGRNERERAFFHVNTVGKSLRTTIRNLPDVFTVDDKVRFNAVLSQKPSEKVKWEATTVYLCKSTDRSGASNSEDSNRSDSFMSDNKSDIHDLPLEKLENQSQETDFNGSPVGYADCRDASSAKTDPCNAPFMKNRNARHSLPVWECRPKFSGKRGFFYPVTQTAGAIKFGPGRSLTACAAVDVTYRDGDPIDNLLWEMADDQEVRFDAVQADDNTWLATLVWIGQRPTQPLVGDSEAIFHRIINRSRWTKEAVQGVEPGPGVDVGGKETPQNLAPGFQPIKPFITIYKDVMGIIVQVMECVAICEVQELEVSRSIEFKSQCFYKDGTMFTGDLKTVLREGDMVFLDYMVGVSGTDDKMGCNLVWQGKRPRVTWQMTAEEFGHRLQNGKSDGENSLCFKDFKTAMRRVDETSRGTSREASDTGLPEFTVPGRKIRSSSASVAGLTAPLAVTSNQTHKRSPGTDNESSVRAPDVSFVSVGVNDEVLLRLVKSLASEFITEEKRLRLVLRDVGCQTIEEDPSPSENSRCDGLAPSLVSSSNGTLKTE